MRVVRTVFERHPVVLWRFPAGYRPLSQDRATCHRCGATCWNPHRLQVAVTDAVVWCVPCALVGIDQQSCDICPGRREATGPVGRHPAYRPPTRPPR